MYANGIVLAAYSSLARSKLVSNPFITITSSSAVLATLLRVDDERPVEALGDVLGQGPHMAVVEVQPGGQGVELVDGPAARPDLAGADPRDAVHLGGVDAVEVDRVRVPGGVDERDPQPLALAARSVGPGMRPL